MEWQQLIIDLFVRISQELERMLDGLTADELNRYPAPNTSTIGWHVRKVDNNKFY